MEGFKLFLSLTGQAVNEAAGSAQLVDSRNDGQVATLRLVHADGDA
jgi:hypothetical protein